MVVNKKGGLAFMSCRIVARTYISKKCTKCNQTQIDFCTFLSGLRFLSFIL